MWQKTESIFSKFKKRIRNAWEYAEQQAELRKIERERSVVTATQGRILALEQQVSSLVWENKQLRGLCSTCKYYRDAREKESMNE